MNIFPTGKNKLIIKTVIEGGIKNKNKTLARGKFSRFRSNDFFITGKISKIRTNVKMNVS